MLGAPPRRPEAEGTDRRDYRPQVCPIGHCPPRLKKGAAAAGRGTERTPSRTPERTPSRRDWRPEVRKAAPERTPRRTPSRREYGVGVCSDSWWCVTERTPDRMAWRPEVRKAAPKGHPEGHPEGHPAAGSMQRNVGFVCVVCFSGGGHSGGADSRPLACVNKPYRPRCCGY